MTTDHGKTLKTEILSCRLDAETLAELRDIANRQGCTISDLLRRGALMAMEEPNRMVITWTSAPEVTMLNPQTVAVAANQMPAQPMTLRELGARIEAALQPLTDAARAIGQRYAANAPGDDGERPEAAAEGTEHGEAVEAVPQACVFVQWKGTEVCLDFHCACGYDGHLDAAFAYGLECNACGRVYEMPHTFFVAPNDFGGVTQMPFPSNHKPSGEGVPQLGQPEAAGEDRDPAVTTAAYLAALARHEAERDRLRRKLDAVRALCELGDLRLNDQFGAYAIDLAQGIVKILDGEAS